MDPHDVVADVGSDNDKKTAPPYTTTSRTENALKMMPKPQHQKNVSWGAEPSSPPMREIGPTSPKDDLDLSSSISDPVLQAAMNGHRLMNSTGETLVGMNELSNEAVSAVVY